MMAMLEVVVLIFVDDNDCPWFLTLHLKQPIEWTCAAKVHCELCRTDGLITWVSSHLERKRLELARAG